METQKQVRLEKEEKKKHQAAMMSEIEKQTQVLLSSFDKQYEYYSDKYDETARLIAETQKRMEEQQSLIAIIANGNFDPTDPEQQRILAEAGIDLNLPEEEIASQLGKSVGQEEVQLSELEQDLAGFRDTMDLIQKAQVQLRNGSELSDDQLRDLQQLNQEINAEMLGELDTIESILETQSESIAVMSQEAIGSASAEDQVEFFVKAVAEYNSSSISSEVNGVYLQKYATLMSQDARDVLSSNTETAVFFLEDAGKSDFTVEDIDPSPETQTANLQISSGLSNF